MSRYTRPALASLLLNLRRFVEHRRATTSIEYAVIAGGISVAIVGVIAGLGSNVQAFYTSVATALK
jgi:pilus assembly protein Flp/PilA